VVLARCCPIRQRGAGKVPSHFRNLWWPVIYYLFSFRAIWAYNPCAKGKRLRLDHLTGTDNLDQRSERIEMCEFCHKHGEGKKWYLQAKNYSEDLLNDLRRRGYIAELFQHPERLGRDANRLRVLDRIPGFVRRT
jgi:hypothetical protein